MTTKHFIDNIETVVILQQIHNLFVMN